MLKRVIIPLVFGIAGVAILVSLGVWQVQRLGWKNARIAQIEARIAQDPVDLPDALDPVRDRFLPVRVSGDFTGADLRVLVSQKHIGAGYRIISVMETGAGSVLIDRGFVPIEQNGFPPPLSNVTIRGNLHWPEEVDGYTPEPDMGADIWFARDVPRMAAHLGARPILIVAAATSEAAPFATPLRVDTASIPNDHLNYAITWFSLALIWASMTAYFIWRSTRPVKGQET